MAQMAKLEPWATSSLSADSLKFQPTSIPPGAPSKGDN
jgi:hypothetical protein